jgi:hypothetical protein
MARTSIRPFLYGFVAAVGLLLASLALAGVTERGSFPVVFPVPFLALIPVCSWFVVVWNVRLSILRAIVLGIPFVVLSYVLAIVMGYYMVWLVFE